MKGPMLLQLKLLPPYLHTFPTRRSSDLPRGGSGSARTVVLSRTRLSRPPPPCDAKSDAWLDAGTASVRDADGAGPGGGRGPRDLAPGSRAGARPRSERLRRTGDVRAVVGAGARARLARAADRRTHRRHRHGPPADAVRRRDARALRGSRGLLGQPPRPGLRHVPGKLARLRANAEARWAHIRGAAGGGHL